MTPLRSAAPRVLITGAGSGFGLALAQRYARDGARVACVDIDPARAEAARAGLHGEGHLAHAVDVADDDAMAALHARIRSEWGGVDVLLNNAGIASAGAMVETTMQEWQRVIDIDLLGVVRGCRLFLPDMLAAGHGHIVNTASFAAIAGAPGVMSYGTAKAAVLALSEQLRNETHGTGVRVSVLCPGFFRTNLMDEAIADADTKRRVVRVMERAPDTLDSVADATYAALRRGEFLIIPTKREPWLYRLKRWAPWAYVRLLRRVALRPRKSR
jgi:NAD(P)-dependent dehydrogenase (short-subunit alcohol dehydrogenase family)